MKITERSKNSHFQEGGLPCYGVIRKFSFSRGVTLLGVEGYFLWGDWYPKAYYGAGRDNLVVMVVAMGGGAGVTQMEWEHTFRCKGQPVGGQLISWRRVNKIGLHMGQCSPPHPLPPTVRNPGCQLKTKYLKPTTYYSKLL